MTDWRKLLVDERLWDYRCKAVPVPLVREIVEEVETLRQDLAAARARVAELETELRRALAIAPSNAIAWQERAIGAELERDQYRHERDAYRDAMARMNAPAIALAALQPPPPIIMPAQDWELHQQIQTLNERIAYLEPIFIAARNLVDNAEEYECEGLGCLHNTDGGSHYMTHLTLTARQRLTTYASLSRLQSDEETYGLLAGGQNHRGNSAVGSVGACADGAWRADVADVEHAARQGRVEMSFEPDGVSRKEYDRLIAQVADLTKLRLEDELVHGNVMGRIAVALFGDQNNRTDEECVARAAEIGYQLTGTQQALFQAQEAAKMLRSEVDALRDQEEFNETALKGYRNNINDLKHDIARHVQIAAEQAQEMEKLRQDLAAARELLPGVYYMDPPDGGDVGVIEQLRSMAKDAERYRWLRANKLSYNGEAWTWATGDGRPILRIDDLDNAIDAALAEGKGQP